MHDDLAGLDDRRLQIWSIRSLHRIQNDFARNLYSVLSLCVVLMTCYLSASARFLLQTHWSRNYRNVYDLFGPLTILDPVFAFRLPLFQEGHLLMHDKTCLLYTSDAADE